MAAIGRHNLFFGVAKLSHPSSAPIRRFATPPLASEWRSLFAFSVLFVCRRGRVCPPWIVLYSLFQIIRTMKYHMKPFLHSDNDNNLKNLLLFIAKMVAK